MLKRNENLLKIQAAIENLAEHPPETPMDQLRAALLVTEATEFLADEADRAERLRKRNTLPDGYRLLCRKPKSSKRGEDETMWSVFYRHGDGSGALTGMETEIGAVRYREKACELAWSHSEEPGLFE